MSKLEFTADVFAQVCCDCTPHEGRHSFKCNASLAAVAANARLTERRARIREILGQLAGAASVCWKPLPTGVFDSSAASKFVDEAALELEKLDENGG